MNPSLSEAAAREAVRRVEEQYRLGCWPIGNRGMPGRSGVALSGLGPSRKCWCYENAITKLTNYNLV